jgi:MFS family permease
MQQGPPGFEENASPELLMLIGAVVLCLGFVLALAGRIAWKHVMSFIGGALGGIFGFVFGTAVGGLLVGLLVSVLGAVIGSALFVFLAQVGLGVVAGLLTYVVAMGIIGDAIVSIILAGTAFIVTIAFVEQAIGVVTAVVGGLLVGIGLIWLDVTDMMIVVVAMFATMVLGAAFQLSVIKEQKEARARGAGVTAPVAPPMPGRACSRCGGQLTYVPEYNRYYCRRCQEYE